MHKHSKKQHLHTVHAKQLLNMQQLVALEVCTPQAHTPSPCPRFGLGYGEPQPVGAKSRPYPVLNMCFVRHSPTANQQTQTSTPYDWASCLLVHAGPCQMQSSALAVRRQNGLHSLLPLVTTCLPCMKVLQHIAYNVDTILSQLICYGSSW